MASFAVAAHALAAAPGQAEFEQRCGVCHALQPTPGKLGPPLGGVIGRKAGSAAGYSYSDAMKAAGFVWTPQKVDAFLGGPSKLVPGTRMMIAPPDPQTRQAIVGYLAAQSRRR
jgi:cytochrome c